MRFCRTPTRPRRPIASGRHCVVRAVPTALEAARAYSALLGQLADRIAADLAAAARSR